MRWDTVKWGAGWEGKRKGKQIIQPLLSGIKEEFRYERKWAGFSWKLDRTLFLNKDWTQFWVRVWTTRATHFLFDSEVTVFPPWLSFRPAIFSWTLTRWLARLPYKAGCKQLIYNRSPEPSTRTNYTWIQGSCEDLNEQMLCAGQRQALSGHLTY